MIKKISISGFVIVASLIMISTINKQTSSGAPSASSGAPGEQTCAMTTCHDDNSLNTGTAQLSIDLPGTMKVGEPATIKIKIKDPGRVRFGFQVTVLDDANKKVGEFIIIDSVRTQTIEGNTNFPDRSYLTYTYYGTLDNDGEAEWEAVWKPTTKGKVTFYVAGISANNDGQDKGDYVYTTSKSATISEPSKTKKISYANDIELTISNHALSILNPYYNFIKTISLTDISGKMILTKILKNSDAKNEINLSEVSEGVVIATLQTSTGTITKKLFITYD